MKKLTVYARLTAKAFAKFVNRPSLLRRLYTVHSTKKPLQLRQRKTLRDVVTVLLSLMDAENNQIGKHEREEMNGYTHFHLRTKRAAEILGYEITKGCWFRAIAQLIDAQYFKSIIAWVFSFDSDDEDLQIRSIASNKLFTPLFFSDLNALMDVDDKNAIEFSRKKSTASRIKKQLSNLWLGYIKFNDDRKLRRDALRRAQAQEEAKTNLHDTPHT